MNAVAVPTGASRGVLLACHSQTSCLLLVRAGQVLRVFGLFGSFLVEDVTMADWVLCRGLIGLAKTVPGQASATTASSSDPAGVARVAVIVVLGDAVLEDSASSSDLAGFALAPAAVATHSRRPPPLVCRSAIMMLRGRIGWVDA